MSAISALSSLRVSRSSFVRSSLFSFLTEPIALRPELVLLVELGRLLAVADVGEATLERLAELLHPLLALAS